MNNTNEMLFLSEYTGPNKTAWVCQRRNKGDYVAIGYQGGLERIAYPFPTEREAEDFAEDWVLLTTPE